MDEEDEGSDHEQFVNGSDLAMYTDNRYAQRTVTTYRRLLKIIDNGIPGIGLRYKGV